MRRRPQRTRGKSALFWAASFVATQRRGDTHAAAVSEHFSFLSERAGAVCAAEKRARDLADAEGEERQRRKICAIEIDTECNDDAADEGHRRAESLNAEKRSAEKEDENEANEEEKENAEDQQPEQAEDKQPEQPGDQQPEQPGDQQPEQPGDQQPEQPGDQQAEQAEDQQAEAAGDISLRPGAARLRLRDALPVAEALLRGELGPVAVAVDIGGTASVRHPDEFDEKISEMERSTGGGDLRGQLETVQVILSLHGESFYAMDSSVCSPLVFLARLLAAPAVIKIILRAQSLHRLLFVYLGTDRVEMNNVVDVSVWSAVSIRMGCPLQQKVSEPCMTIQDVWRLIPETTQEIIQLRISESSVVGCADKVSGGEKDSMKSSGDAETSIVVVRDVVSMGHVPTADLVREFRDLATLHAFYDGYLCELHSRGTMGESTSSIAEICQLETYTSFLCDVMSFHGVMVNKSLLDLMIDDIDQQIVALVDKGNAELRSEGASDENDMNTITAEDCLTLLYNLRGVRVDNSLSKQRVIQQLTTLAAEEGEDGGPARIWLCIREYHDLKKTLWGLFVNGARVRPRVIMNTEPLTTTTTATSVVRESTSAVKGRDGSTFGLFFSVHPQWSVHHGSTGRIYGSHPSLQTLPKQSPCSRVQPRRLLFTNAEWTQRHLFGPPPGCALLSFDFNQIELRVLAHLSRDSALIAHLLSGRDLLSEMAKHMLALHAVDEVTPLQRQTAKVVVYGLLYGMGPKRMDEHISQLRQQTQKNKEDSASTSSEAQQQEVRESLPRAVDIMRAFSQCYPGAYSFLKNTRLTAFHQRRCVTINGVYDLSKESDGNRRKQLSVAQSIQGSAATILHHAMTEVHRRRHKIIPFLPAAPFALVLTVHDELVYAVPDAVVSILAPAIKEIIEERSVAMNLRVPLRVSVKHGKSLGAMELMEI